MINPSNLWLETRSNIQDRVQRDREARTQIFWAYNVNTGNWEGERAPAIQNKRNNYLNLTREKKKYHNLQLFFEDGREDSIFKEGKVNF